ILILGIIALIAIPVVNNIIKESKKNAFKATIDNVVNAAETKCQLEQLKGESITTSYDFSDSSTKTKLNVKGKIPINGTMTLNDSCLVTDMNVDDGSYTATLSGGKISVTNGSVTPKVCTLVTAKTPGTISIGDKYTCNPGDNTDRIFYVLEVTDSNISLIMDRNIDNTTVAFCNQSGVNSSDGIACQADGAIAKMNATTSGWAKVLVNLPTGQQIANAGGLTTWTDNGTYVSGLPAWLYGNLSENPGPYGYWTKTPQSDNAYYAWYVSYNGNLSNRYNVVLTEHQGVRPVITISKSQI
ncbi:MAG TPA: DUF6273 domain-containing protein, partial [Bacilli bacterium]|nr:DUF6273 domain-containing protein [Bacilli bacterium]